MVTVSKDNEEVEAEVGGHVIEEGSVAEGGAERIELQERCCVGLPP